MSRLPNIYAVAMQELQELESEPLCHRIAARLLVNNCQLLDGKDDATVLIDSGRQIRDFVDSYAASLAICDLERGTQIPDSKFPRLHVSPQQIDSCLSGLARSDSAWNTWVSYRHKALRFCEAARADNDKAQSIRLHQRLTEVLSKLSEGVEQELESHLHAINTRATEVTDQLRRIIPDVDRLRDSIQDVDRTLSQQIMETAQELSHLRVTELAGRQQNLEKGLGRLFELTEDLSSQYEVHSEHLTDAQKKSEDILVTLDKMANSASDPVVLPSAGLIEDETNMVTMASKAKIALIQMHPKAVSPEDNFRKAESYIRNAASQGCALAVLPEYHLTSWAPDHPDFVLSCEQSGSYLRSYQALAKELSISIVPGTIVEPEGEGDDLDLINAAYFIGPDGAILGRYEKKNLWHNERPHLTKGPQPHGAFDTPLGRAGLLVCWDLAFPEAFRELIRDGARIIVCPAFWMADEYKRGGSGEVVNRDSEKVFLENVLVARAFENTAAVVLVNAGGPEGGVERRWDGSQLRYCGVSQVAMPLIGSIGKLGAEEAVSIVEVDLGLLDVAEGAYKVREDMQKEGWHYGYSITKE
ncbi:hypothetical protein K4K57_005790 [Colletotrichum sp. SAR 10_99]|nr:hypothetical protein K4K55_003876 [Colletotrichum sp. SAR 10_96]KAJ5011339.1 hypothetical protein K4K57_005790 [Colletotrichum sp. SAR 10_99]